MKKITDIIMDHGINERLDQIALADAEYLKRDKEYSALLDQCRTVNMSKKQIRLVDAITAAFAAQSARYAELAYRMGLKDGAALCRF